MKFNTVLNLRTEGASQRGVVILQFVPLESIGSQQLTLSTTPEIASALEVGEQYEWAAIKVDAGSTGGGSSAAAMSFRATLNERTESATALGVARLQFLPTQNIGATQLSMTVPLAISTPLEVGAEYRFEAVKVEPQVLPEGEGAQA